MDTDKAPQSASSSSSTPNLDSPLSGSGLIREERIRQLEKWSLEHDKEHRDQELIGAALCYASFHRVLILTSAPEGYVSPWPWEPGDEPDPMHLNSALTTEEHPPEDWYRVRAEERIRRLTIAGALLAAEIDRIKGCLGKNPAGE